MKACNLYNQCWFCPIGICAGKEIMDMNVSVNHVYKSYLFFSLLASDLFGLRWISKEKSLNKALIKLRMKFSPRNQILHMKSSDCVKLSNCEVMFSLDERGCWTILDCDVLFVFGRMWSIKSTIFFYYLNF